MARSCAPDLWTIWLLSGACKSSSVLSITAYKLSSDVDDARVKANVDVLFFVLSFVFVTY